MQHVITVGRSTENDVTINNPTVSKEHAMLIIDQSGNLFIKDLSSSNGTFVNDQKIIVKTPLKSNDKVMLGNYAFNWEAAILKETEKQEAANKPTKDNTDKAIAEAPPKKKKKWLTTVIVLLLIVGAIAFVYNLSDDENTITSENQSSWQLKNKQPEYSIDCLRNKDFLNEMIGFGADLQDAFFDDENVEVSIKDEEKIGEEVKKQMKEEYRFIKDEIYFDRIDAIAKKLTKFIKDTSDYNYQWYVMETDMINAFTVGGKIFFTTGIIDFAESDDELACVMGHEIYHNELGHIKKKLKKEKVAKNWFGDILGEVSYIASEIIGTSFNQESEAYCDMHGIDLAVKSGYDGCAAIGFWERMSAEEGEKDELSKLMRSHPYSDERAGCIHDHVDRNYVKSCKM